MTEQATTSAPNGSPVETGPATKKPRKQRSDKGKPRGPRKPPAPKPNA